MVAIPRKKNCALKETWDLNLQEGRFQNFHFSNASGHSKSQHRNQQNSSIPFQFMGNTYNTLSPLWYLIQNSCSIFKTFILKAWLTTNIEIILHKRMFIQTFLFSNISCLSRILVELNVCCWIVWVVLSKDMLSMVLGAYEVCEP
jgi:hypothetical protein